MRQALRWLLLPAAAIISWYIALALGAILFGIAYWLCPDSEVVASEMGLGHRGECVAPWAPFVTSAGVCVGAALAAALIVLSCTWVAPSHRQTTALVVYLGGVAWAVYLGLTNGTYAAMASAIAAGALVTLQLRRGLRRGAAA
jgi:hypothetical protein